MPSTAALYSRHLRGCGRGDGRGCAWQQVRRAQRHRGQAACIFFARIAYSLQILCQDCLHKLFAPVCNVCTNCLHKLFAQTVCANYLARFKKVDTRRTVSKRSSNYLRKVFLHSRKLFLHSKLFAQTVCALPQTLSALQTICAKFCCTPASFCALQTICAKCFCTPGKVFVHSKLFALHSRKVFVHSKLFANSLNSFSVVCFLRPPALSFATGH